MILYHYFERYTNVQTAKEYLMVKWVGGKRQGYL